MPQQYRWGEKKNAELQRTRRISFEEIIEAMAQRGLLDVLRHHNVQKYGRQKLFVVRCRGYVYLVPFVESPGEIFLKTIIPSRKYQRRYGGKAQ